MNDKIIERIVKNVTEHKRKEKLFLSALKRAIEMIGVQYFNCDTELRNVKKIDQISPNLGFIEEVIMSLSSGEQKFLAGISSFYDSERGAELLKRVNSNGLGDISLGLDNEHRQVIADLFVSYSGW